jgi:quercetin dioxygenase-like cupin family protein
MRVQECAATVCPHAHDGARPDPIPLVLTAAETGGRLVRAELWAPPGCAPVPMHVHADGEERIELMAGAMWLRVGSTQQTLGPGDPATIPAGVAHAWANPGAEVLHFMFELAPAPAKVFPRPWIG